LIVNEGKWMNITDFPGGWRKFNTTTHDFLKKISETPMTDMQLEKWFEGRFQGTHMPRKQGIKNGINFLKKLDFIQEKQDKPLKMHDLTNKGHEYLSSDDKNDFLFKIVDRTYGGLSEIVDILKKNGGLDLKGIRGRLSNTPNKDPLSRRLQMLKALNKIIYHDHKYAQYSSTTFSKNLDTSKDTSAHKLANYLKFHYHIEVKYERKGWLTFPSGTMVLVHGNDKGKNYNISVNVCSDLTTESNRYYAVVFEQPQTTFILPKSKLQQIFVGVPNKSKRWIFGITKKNEKYKLKLHMHGTTSHNIQEFLNKWDQIEDFKNSYQQTNTGIDVTQRNKNGTSDQYTYTDSLYEVPVDGNKEADKINHTITRKSGKYVYNRKSELKSWHLFTAQDIDEIASTVLQGNKGKEERLAIDPEIVKRIIKHLISSKHVILVGPPGIGKTDLAKRLLEELGKRMFGKANPIEAVASYEWGRYEVIGGNSLEKNRKGKYIFHLGCVTNAIREGKLLLIDEFNRADMNKAFGEMFLAIDHGTIPLREDENRSNF
jgi:AAA domain (dynein-related subfamily)